MQRYFVATAIIMAGLFVQSRAMLAQDTNAPVQNAYVITYIEVAPGSMSAARQLIVDYAVDARKASGVVAIEGLQRIDYPHHFALVEQWQSPAAKQAYASSDSVVKFRNALAPLQSAGYDERIHHALSIGPSMPASADSVVFVTHVDVVPPALVPGSGSVKAFAEQGRGATGNRRFDAWTQTSRQNHMTVVETWDAMADKNNWISTATAKSFREGLHPMSGALYDERAYKLLR
ncbi:MAG TPA: antibiotic biosynthesis monooxygenase family protein [Bradyrhizobium sp.]|nr:antibiotic biosynthesis monooxygenase family protein [Bradyrhizobium sp.]